MMFECEVVVREGVSTKTNKPYKMYVLIIHTGVYGDVEIVLDTYKSRAGIVLSMLADAIK